MVNTQIAALREKVGRMTPGAWTKSHLPQETQIYTDNFTYVGETRVEVYQDNGGGRRTLLLMATAGKVQP